MKKRYFSSREDNRINTAVHAIGNGEIMLYGRGPEWIQVIGAPYSCPTVFSLTVPESEEVHGYSVRRENSGSYEHRLEQGLITDCASEKCHCIARHWELEKPIRFDVKTKFSLTSAGRSFQCADSVWMISLPANAAAYNDYPIGMNTCVMIAVKGGCSAELTDDGLILTLKDQGTMYVTGAESFPICAEQMKYAHSTPFEEILSDADVRDSDFLSDCAAKRRLSGENPMSSRISEAIDDVLMLIKAQQHRSGGVQAGYNYHLAYVRDQYGVSRGLLAMGAHDSAGAILRFYRSVFQKSGHISNAQGMGVDGMFHVHENDSSEITGYLLLQATDYLTVTGDTEFFGSLIPMCDWALREQLSCLHNNMLPFNGDETYIPGGMLPRTALNHGSFEATMLFITGARRYIDACRGMGREDSLLDEADRAVREAADHFDENFMRNGIYAANSVKRLDGLTEPEYRHGVCCFNDSFGWTTRAAEGWYLCPDCMRKKTELIPNREEYVIKSTLLMSPFIHADLIPREYISRTVSEYLEEYRTTGKLPSRPDGSRNLGYDYGLLLFAAAETGLEADDLLCKMLNLCDDVGAWWEYYNDGVQSGTGCRPWESGINIAGAIKYLENQMI